MGGRGRGQEEERLLCLSQMSLSFRSRTSVDDGTFRRSSLTGSLTDHARGERRLGAAKSLSFELLLLTM